MPDDTQGTEGRNAVARGSLRRKRSARPGRRGAAESHTPEPHRHVVPRAERLLALLEDLRGRRHPVRGETLATRLGVSLRTLYRDIAALQGLGARIAGAPGIGYVLRPGFTLPPLAFTDDELDALWLGARWVADRGDGALAEAAARAVGKIGAALPSERRTALEVAPLLVNPGGSCERTPRRPTAARAGGVPDATRPGDLAVIRAAIRRERKLVLTYADLADRVTVRTVWPVALVFFEQVRVLVAWCELRGAFRHFRPDRLRGVATSDERSPRRRHVLLAEWRTTEALGPAAGDPLQRRPR